MKKFLIIAIFTLLIPGIARAQDLQLAAGETVSISLTSPAVTYNISSTTGIDSLTANGNTLTLTLSAGDNVTVFSADGYQIDNNLGQATPCGGLTTTLTFTQTVTITASTTSCSGGGGGGSYSPNSIEIKINNGSVETTDRKATLSLSASDVLSMMLSNDSSFTGVSWEPFAKTKSWTLTEGFGQKTVYAKFLSSSGGVSSVVNASITLVESISKITPKEEKKEVKLEIPQGDLEGRIVKYPKKSAVYIIENGKLRPYINEQIFLAHKKNFLDVIETNLDMYPMGDPINFFPDTYNVTCGQLLKASNSKVYIVSKCEEGQPKEITWIQSEEVFLKSGWSFNTLHLISDGTIAKFKEAQPFNQLNIHPTGTLVKYAKDPKVYILQKIDGVVKKSWITNEAEFNKKGFQFSNVIEIDSKEIYPDGLNIGGIVLGESFKEFESDLEMDSVGKEVRFLQKKLQQLGFFPKDVSDTGYFGPVTKEAVVEFQKAYGLQPGGRVDIQTRQILNNL